MTTEQKRLLVLKKLMEGQSQKEFQEKLRINQGYLSQLMNGRKNLSEKSAIKFEAMLGLVPGTLVKPQDVDSIESVDRLYLKAGHQLASGLDQSAAEEVIKQIEDRRLAILLAILGDQSLNGFCSNHDLNTSYVSQLINGVKTIGERSAKTLEEKLNLVPDSLMHPNVINTADAEAVSALFKAEHKHLSTPGQGLLRQLSQYLRAGLLTDDHINILKLTAGEFAKASNAAGTAPEVDEILQNDAEADPENLHFRVTLLHELNPNKTISVMAPDKDAAKNLAGQRYPDWEVTMARLGKVLVTGP